MGVIIELYLLRAERTVDAVHTLQMNEDNYSKVDE